MVEIATIEEKIRQVARELSDAEWDGRETDGLRRFLESLYEQKAAGHNWYIPF